MPDIQSLSRSLKCIISPSYPASITHTILDFVGYGIMLIILAALGLGTIFAVLKGQFQRAVITFIVCVLLYGYLAR